MKFYIADTHFSHESIIRLCNRPFASVQEMDKTLICNWNSVVSDEDEVFILGDFSGHCKHPENYLAQLHGQKHLIVGNHDEEVLASEEALAQFVTVQNYLEIQDGDKTVILFHYPIVEWNKKIKGSIHLYGHVHNMTTDGPQYMKTIKNAYNVGADVLGFTPRTLAEIIG